MTNNGYDFTFATYSELPELDADDTLVVKALEKRGLRTQAAVWNDSTVDWAKGGICLIRSTWDYHLHYDEFLQWAERVNSVTVLKNDLQLVKWNSHKSYLKDLTRNGAPVVPTVWVRKGGSTELASVMRDNAWAEVIIKPAVGLATFGVRRVLNTPGRMREGQAHLDALVRTSDVMIQPYFSSVVSYGERALTFVNGEFTHCVRKSPFQALMPAGRAGEALTKALPEEIDIAYGIINSLERMPLFARVDLVRDDVGCPKLIELELVEPSLFFTMHPPAAERFADVLVGLKRAVANTLAAAAVS